MFEKTINCIRVADPPYLGILFGPVRGVLPTNE